MLLKGEDIYSVVPLKKSLPFPETEDASITIISNFTKYQLTAIIPEVQKVEVIFNRAIGRKLLEEVPVENRPEEQICSRCESFQATTHTQKT